MLRSNCNLFQAAKFWKMKGKRKKNFAYLNLQQPSLEPLPSFIFLSDTIVSTFLIFLFRWMKIFSFFEILSYPSVNSLLLKYHTLSVICINPFSIPTKFLDGCCLSLSFQSICFFSSVFIKKFKGLQKIFQSFFPHLVCTA